MRDNKMITHVTEKLTFWEKLERRDYEEHRASNDLRGE